MFPGPSIGAFIVIDTNIRLLEASGNKLRGHNFLKEREIRILRASDDFPKNLTNTLITSVTFNIALTCAVRPTELYSFKMNQVLFIDIEKKKALQIVGKIIGNEGESKN